MITVRGEENYQSLCANFAATLRKLPNGAAPLHLNEGFLLNIALIVSLVRFFEKPFPI